MEDFDKILNEMKYLGEDKFQVKIGDEVKEFDSKEEADAYIAQMNAKQNQDNDFQNIEVTNEPDEKPEAPSSQDIESDETDLFKGDNDDEDEDEEMSVVDQTAENFELESEQTRKWAMELSAAEDAVIEPSKYQYYEEYGAVAMETSDSTNSGESEWIVFADMDDAKQAAIEKVKDDLNHQPEIFNQEWLAQHISISESDKSAIANEEAEAYVDNYTDEDLLERFDNDSRVTEIHDMYDELEEEADELRSKITDLEIDEDDPDIERSEKEAIEEKIEEYNDRIEEIEARQDALQSKKDNLAEEFRDELREEFYDEIYVKLDDPIEYFVNEMGMYSQEELLSASFIYIDDDEAAEDAVSEDGIAHFLDVYDGEEIELPSGAVAFGTN